MRYSELGTKEIVNLFDGTRVGMLGETDLVIDEATGEIREIVVPSRHGFWRSQSAMSLNWGAIRRIGPEIIIVEIAPEGLGVKRQKA